MNRLTPAPSNWDYFPTAWKDTEPRLWPPLFNLLVTKRKKTGERAESAATRRCLDSAPTCQHSSDQAGGSLKTKRVGVFGGRFAPTQAPSPAGIGPTKARGWAEFAGNVLGKGATPSPPRHPAGPTAGRAPRDDRSAKAGTRRQFLPAARPPHPAKERPAARSPRLGSQAVNWIRELILGDTRRAFR